MGSLRVFKSVSAYKQIAINYRSILRESYEELKKSITNAFSSFLSSIEIALKKGFAIENGTLVYKDKIKVKYFTNGEKVVELENPYYVENIVIESFYPLTIRAEGYHPHLHNDTNQFCIGDIGSFEEFINGFPTNVETVYVNSVYHIDDVKDKLKKLGLLM